MKVLSKRQHFIAVFFLFFVMMTAGFLEKDQIQANAMNVSIRSEDDIRNYVRNNGASLYDIPSFTKDPFVEIPYDFGILSEGTRQSALRMVNQLRYIAGIPDNVTVSDSYCQYAQAAAFVNYLNNQVSQPQTKPWGLDDYRYQMGSTGASKSIHSVVPVGKRNLNETIVMSWMKDNDSSDISTLEHRRWLLNPKMAQIGFGVVSGNKGTFSSAYVKDTNNLSAPQTGVAWPARKMPVEYFTQDFPWSISMGHTVNQSAIKVRLTKLSDSYPYQNVWTFSNSSSDGYFHVDNSSYGQPGCIIFRPNGITSYRDGDVYRVDITGDITPITYLVEFFSLNSVGTTAYTTSFNSQGGSAVSPIVISQGGRIAQIPIPTKSNAEFLGWYTSPNGQGAQLTTSTVIYENRTYYAYWRNKVGITSLSASYSGNAYAGADVYSGLTVYANYSDGHSEKVSGYTVSAKTLVTGVNMITVTYNGISENVLIVASQKPSSTSTPVVTPTDPAIYYTIVFHPNGGTNLSFQSITIRKGEAIDALPTVERENYAFKGWYTQVSGGIRVGRTSLPDSEKVLYARWERVGRPSKVSEPSLKSPARGQLKVSFKEVEGAKGYEISYSTTQSFAAAYTKKVTTSYTTKTITDLRPGVVYYVKVRAYKKDSTGKKIYGYNSVRKELRVRY